MSEQKVVYTLESLLQSEDSSVVELLGVSLHLKRPKHKKFVEVRKALVEALGHADTNAALNGFERMVLETVEEIATPEQATALVAKDTNENGQRFCLQVLKFLGLSKGGEDSVYENSSETDAAFLSQGSSD